MADRALTFFIICAGTGLLFVCLGLFSYLVAKGRDALKDSLDL